MKEHFSFPREINVMTVTWTELEVQRQAFLAKDLNFVLKENKMKLKKKKNPFSVEIQSGSGHKESKKVLRSRFTTF